MTKLISRISLTLIATLSLAISLLGGFAPSAHAQLVPMGIPIPTTVIVTKPAPGQIFGDAQTITMGVGAKTYKFGLKDAYVADPRGKVRWPDIWQWVRQHRPNFNVTGVGEAPFEKIQPGQTMTVHSLVAPPNPTI